MHIYSVFNISIFGQYLRNQPTPIVDGIQEHEKYGNNGDKFYGAGRALVNTYEGFSNILNKVIDVSVFYRLANVIDTLVD